MGQGAPQGPARSQAALPASVLHDASAIKIDPRRHDAVGLVQLPRERRLDVLPSLLALPAAGCIDFTAGMAWTWLDRSQPSSSPRRSPGWTDCPLRCGYQSSSRTRSAISARDGWQAASRMQGVARAVAPAVEGMLRCVRRGDRLPKYNERVSAAAGGVLVADYLVGTVNRYRQLARRL